MYENGIFQIWHKKSKNSGNMFTAIVSVNKFGKLQFVFEESHVLLAMQLCRTALTEAGIVVNSLYDVYTTDKEFVYDIEQNKLTMIGG